MSKRDLPISTKLQQSESTSDYIGASLRLPRARQKRFHYWVAQSVEVEPTQCLFALRYTDIAHVSRCVKRGIR